MNFVFPSFLFALSAISIPIIIHLFNFRKFKKINFTNVRFIKEVKRDTQSKSRLKHLLVLLMRVLAILFLVFAFAQPYIPIAKNAVMESERAVSIYVDNSFSMEAIGKNGTLIEQAKSKAAEIAKAYKPSDKFQLLTNDFEARHQRLMNREEFLQQLEEVKISPSVRSLSEILSRQQEALNTANAKKPLAYLLSDFQKTMVDLDKVKKDTNLSIRMLPFESQKTGNVFIDSCWFASPVRKVNETIHLLARIKNLSDDAIENIPVKLMINGKQKSPGSVTIPANSSVVDTISFTLSETGWQDGEIAIADHPITFDDNYFFSFEINERINVLCINGDKSNYYLDHLFGNDSSFVFKNSSEKTIDYSGFNNEQVIILNELPSISSGLLQELVKYVKKGGSLLVIPSADISTSSYNEMLQTFGCNTFGNLMNNSNKVRKINLEDEVYKEVFTKINDNIDLPVVNKHYSIVKSSKSNEMPLLTMDNGESFLSKYPVEKGKVYVTSAPLNKEFSNFTQHAIFVPTILKITLLSINNNRLSYTISKDESFDFDKVQISGDNVFHLTNKESNFDVIPEHRMMNNVYSIYLHNQIKSAGNFHLVSENKPLATYSFNYDRNESDLKCITASELEELSNQYHINNTEIIKADLPSISKQLSQLESGIQLWKYCLIFALAFFAIEELILRLWK
ncbi:MAG: BatA domain-containing protein [Bacteroidota bacterium]